MIHHIMENDKLITIRHSLAHLLAMAVLEIDPGAKLGIGPVIENGFYYDILTTKPLSNGQLPQLENKMRAFMKRNPSFIHETASIEEGKKLFASQPFKIELINDLISEKKVTEVSTYKTGAFLDLCQGPHIKTANEIPLDGFKLTKLAGAYWRGSEKNQMLTRIY
ncbi:MAG: threonine--tRNA ligase, partial [Patescibacteria group bacterium]